MTAWVLLRGLARESGHWGGFLPCLQESLGRADIVISHDLPGTGANAGQPSPATVEAIARACRASAGAWRRSAPIVLVGMSLGGLVADAWARQGEAGEVAGCVLINSSLRGLSPPWERLRPGNLAPLARAFASADPLAREEAILLLTSARPGLHPGIALSWAVLAQRRPMRRATVLRQLVAASRYRAGAAPPAASTLLLACAHDRLVSPRCTQAIASAWQCEAELHPWAGHDVALDDPQWLAGRLAAWSRRRGLSRN